MDTSDKHLDKNSEISEEKTVTSENLMPEEETATFENQSQETPVEEKQALEDQATEIPVEDKKTSESQTTETPVEDKKTSESQTTETPAEDKAVTESQTTKNKSTSANKAPETSEPEEPPKKKRHIVRNIFLGLLILVILAALGVYIAGVLYFKERFFLHTTVNGFDASELTVEEVESQIAAEIATYQLTVEERGDQVETITSKQINYHYVSKGETQTFKNSQNIYLWPRCLWEEQTYTFESSAQYDEQMLTDAVDGLDAMQEENVTKPADAFIDYLDGTYYVIKEVEGNELIPNKVHRLVQEAVDFGKTSVSLEENQCYETPKKRQDDQQLNDGCEELNTISSTSITYVFSSQTEALNGDTIRQWLSYDKDGNVTLDESKIREFVKNLADKYDSADKPREFKTHDGRTVSVSGGYYGWIMDCDTETAELTECIKTGYQGDRYAVFSQSAVSFDNSDLGYSYVEIDLTNQHVWLYIDGEEIVSTDCVSGNMSIADRVTPPGTYTLAYKQSPAVLRGANNEYESPVTYWMPFNGGIGLHDATWRGSFGGNIYKTNGSHGCINLPLSAAKTIYENVYDGIPIICYY